MKAAHLNPIEECARREADLTGRPMSYTNHRNTQSSIQIQIMTQMEARRVKSPPENDTVNRGRKESFENILLHKSGSCSSIVRLQKLSKDSLHLTKSLYVAVV